MGVRQSSSLVGRQSESLNPVVDAVPRVGRRRQEAGTAPRTAACRPPQRLG